MAYIISVETRYGLEGTGFESRWGEIFLTHPDRNWGPQSFLYNGYRDSFPAVKWTERGVDNPPTSSAKVKKKRVEIYL